MANNTKGTRGIRAVRKRVGAQVEHWARKFAPHIILAAFIAALVLIFPYGETVRHFDLPMVGTASKETVIAPFTFDVLRTPEEFERERRRAADAVLLVADYDDAAEERSLRSLAVVFAATATVANPEASEADRLAAQALLSRDFPDRVIATFLARPDIFTEVRHILVELLGRGVSATFIYASPEELHEQERRTTRFRTQSGAQSGAGRKYTERFLTLVRGGAENIVAVADVPAREAAIEQAVSRLRRDRRFDNDAVVSAVTDLLYAALIPNVRVNEAETQARKDAAADAVPETVGRVSRDTEIVRRHQEVTPDIVQKLHSLRVALELVEGETERRRTAAGRAGHLALVLIPFLYLSFYVAKYKPSLVRNVKSLLALCIVVLLQIGLVGFGLAFFPPLFEAWGIAAATPEYLIPSTMAALLCTILFGMQVSVVVSLFIGIYLGVATGFNHYFFLYAFLNSAVAAFLNYRIRYRWHFFKAIPPMFFMSVATIAVWQFMSWRFDHFFINILCAFVAVLAAVFATMTLLPFFERIFDITTDMTLIELSDMNHPVLKRLSIEAAGTYNHCVLVGNLAESAAQAIGANALLARVASYYHDIGKIDKPDYYVENCMRDKNRHNKLSPSMSALIICSHVKEGVDLAKKHKLPKVIQDIIMQHHGTTLVSFFYEKALELDPHKQVQEKDFQYPGPPPQTREAAIIMLADSVEAASRSLASSSPKLLRELVKKIIRDKFLTSQLDQCNLTLRDLNDIGDGFMPVLQGIFHTRIEYPDKDK